MRSGCPRRHRRRLRAACLDEIIATPVGNGRSRRVAERPASRDPAEDFDFVHPWLPEGHPCAGTFPIEFAVTKGDSDGVALRTPRLLLREWRDLTTRRFGDNRGAGDERAPAGWGRGVDGAARAMGGAWFRQFVVELPGRRR